MPHVRRRLFVCGAAILLALALAGCSLPFGEAPTTPPVVVIVTATSAPNAPDADADLAPTLAALSGTATALAGAPTAALPDSAATPAPGAAATPTAEGGVLQRVQARGRLLCGANADLPGFGFYDRVRDQWSGFDVDFCRALAAAVLGDASAIDFVGLTTAGANERFEAVRSGRVDVLFRNTTWTFGRDLAGLAFGPTTFHDGQTFMVRADAGIANVDGLAGRRICVASGTTSEQNARDELAARGIEFELVLFEDGQLYPAYERGECDAVTSDSSQLAAERQALDAPDQHTILGDRISREPLGPAFVEGDEQWRDVVSWTVFATIYAEELRVSQANLAQESASDDPRIRRLLGLEGDFGSQLGLSPDFALQIIRQVGNYADIYDRNLGPATPFDLERGPNKVWNLGAGGVLASPPFR